MWPILLALGVLCLIALFVPWWFIIVWLLAGLVVAILLGTFIRRMGPP